MGDFSCVSNTTGVSFYYSSKLRFQSEEKESDTGPYNRSRYSVLTGITYTTDSCIQADIGISTGGSPRS